MIVHASTLKSVLVTIGETSFRCSSSDAKEYKKTLGSMVSVVRTRKTKPIMHGPCRVILVSELSK